MAYCIFLKSLRILEEFRKNPCVKIPSKSPYTHFQSLGKFKIPISIPKGFFSAFGPIGPAASRPTHPFGSPRPADLLLPPHAETEQASPDGLAPPPSPPPATSVVGEKTSRHLLLHSPIKWHTPSSFTQ
jgi:hypothetical protein